MDLKLNKRRTFLIAFGFFGVLMVWNVYYYYIPLFLEDLLLSRNPDSKPEDFANIIGHIMSLDNLAAIIIIPLFSWLSDRTKSRFGKRIPYIVIGSAASLILFPLIAAMYLVNAFAWYFVIVILLVIAMQSFRSPVVALMPDVTPKPLRISANAIINFIGYIGGILGTGIIMIIGFFPNVPLNSAVNLIPFIATSLVLASVIVTFILRFSENKVVASMKDELAEGERLSETIEVVKEDKPLSRQDKFNFAIIIAAVFFCWFAFNALMNFGSVYARNQLGEGANWAMNMTVLPIASLAAFLPAIWLTKKLGRKWSVIIGLAIVVFALVMAAAFTPLMVRNLDMIFVNIILAIFFGISGIGWAIVNVNTFPMFVEVSTSKNIGFITGIYYLVSQGAMFLTSNISGYVYRGLGYGFYYWYAIIFMSLALGICFLFRQKKVTQEPKPSAPCTLESNECADEKPSDQPLPQH